MKILKTKLNGKEFTLGVALTDKDKTKGLSGSKKLKKGAGMFFVFNEEQSITMNMYKMNYPIDMIFLDKDFDVVHSARMQPGKDITIDDAKYVVEVNAGELPALPVGMNLDPGKEFKMFIRENMVGKNVIVKLTEENSKLSIFKRGGKITRKETDLKALPDAMQVLNDTGIVLMNIKGGERIFSRKHTEQILDLAKKIKSGEAEAKELGKLMMKIIHIQDTQDPEYVYE